VHPDLPVFDGIKEVFGVELISEMRTILLEATLDFDTLIIGEEFGGIGVVVNEFECNASNDNGEDAFQNLFRMVNRWSFEIMYCSRRSKPIQQSVCHGVYRRLSFQ